ncbi:MAG TPA: hypothetical protein VHW65_12740 [Gemmatimonadales bacterium]|jgi:hypothetical protein|nr:hypothetical protein [Gemmatimonadales bacterium]
MRTVDRRVIRAAPASVWQRAVAIEAWPAMLRHYRWVRRDSGVPGGAGVVEMAAWRPFGPFKWPTWWCSDMAVDPDGRRITYQHIKGITRGMAVLWTIDATPEGWSDVTIVHTWSGPRWPLIGPAVARWIIGPIFVHGIAARTLAGIDRAATAGA